MIWKRQLASPGLFNVASRSVGISGKHLIKRSFSWSKWKVNPPPAGGVMGDVNVPYQPPQADPLHGSYHWTYERATAAALLPLTAYSLGSALTGNEISSLVDTALCTTFLFYAQFEFLSCIIDYIPKRRFGVWHNCAKYVLYSGTVLGLCGIYELETKENGFVDLVSKLWRERDEGLYIFGK